MALALPEIDAVVHEIASNLTGGWVQKIHQPTQYALILVVRAAGQTFRLFLSADPKAARLHLLTERLPNPSVPLPFCQYVRARIQGGRVEQVEQIQGDRVVRITLTVKQKTYSLVAALTGRSADLVLLDDRDRILASLRHGQEQCGQDYVLPPNRPDRNIPSERTGSVEPLASAFPVSASIQRRYHEHDQECARQRLRQSRVAHIRKAIKKMSRRVQALQSDLDKAERFRGYARYGELLKANLGRLVKGEEQVTVVDYFDPDLPELNIPLDPAKHPKDNMQEYFRKHRKYLAAEREIRPRLAQAERDVKRLQQEQRSIEEGVGDLETSPLLPKEAPKPSTHPRRDRKKMGPDAHTRSGPFRRFTSTDGLLIYVGRNARENEELTHTFAHSDDLWLHARGTPGSHVVVRLEKGTEPPHETLRDAATLALLYSDLKKSGKGEVLYTRKKWVRKAKGKPPGTVIVTREKSLYVSLDKTRLEGLKQRSQ